MLKILKKAQNWYQQEKYKNREFSGRDRYEANITANFYMAQIDNPEKKEIAEGILRENLNKLEQHIENNPNFPETITSTVEFSINNFVESPYGKLV